MFKKAGFVTASVAAIMMIGGTAFASVESGNDWPGHHDGDQGQSIDFLNDIDILENVNLCGNQVNVIAVPVLNLIGADCSAASVDE
ncbi:hypothetical protein CFN78_10980 [Amycolatopsis antarctica]|uniref:DUF320 domain-containing protein n=1 Tax=Amycolatopsis antarctica TaxID=1854586 RepID=A0A263D4H8_9PSEU|nr:hypothetical protein [Amycolatopsis antarctica]OZM73360.1 hypothetical protein CFN78_10980 [Amycolatopsis antarctica]